MGEVGGEASGEAESGPGLIMLSMTANQTYLIYVRDKAPKGGIRDIEKLSLHLINTSELASWLDESLPELLELLPVLE